MTNEDHAHWGQAAAAALQERYPNLAEVAHAGLSADCETLMAELDGPTAVSSQLQSIFTEFETGMKYLIDRHDTAQAEWQNEKTDLVNRLSNALLAKAEQPSGRRLSQDPDKFGGTEKDSTKRQQQYANWRSQIGRCFGVDSNIFNSEYRKIQHISSLLKDTAYEVHREKFDTITANPDNPEHWHWKTAADVFFTLNEQYETIDLSLQASRDFDNLYMTNKPFPNFLAEFTNLAARCNKTQEQMVEALRVKVSQELSDEITHRSSKPARSDFHAWAVLCQGIYNDLEEQKHVDKLRSARLGAARQGSAQRHGHTSAPNTQPQSQATVDAGDPMALDAIRPTREQCIQYGLCYYCKKPGHTKDQCVEKQQNDARRSIWNGLTRHSPNPSGRPVSGPPSGPRKPSTPFPRAPSTLRPNAAWGTFDQLRQMEPGFVTEINSLTGSTTPSVAETPQSETESTYSQPRQGKE